MWKTKPTVLRAQLKEKQHTGGNLWKMLWQWSDCWGYQYFSWNFHVLTCGGENLFPLWGKEMVWKFLTKKFVNSIIRSDITYWTVFRCRLQGIFSILWIFVFKLYFLMDPQERQTIMRQKLILRLQEALTLIHLYRF